MVVHVSLQIPGDDSASPREGAWIRSGMFPHLYYTVPPERSWFTLYVAEGCTVSPKTVSP